MQDLVHAVDRLMTTRQNLWKEKLAFKRSVSVCVLKCP